MTPPRPHVLIVDDHEDVRRLVVRHGFTPLLAASGFEAVELLQRHHADIAVVVLDVEMEGMDGPRTLAALRKLVPALRCVFVTGQSPRYTTETLAGLGAAVVVGGRSGGRRVGVVPTGLSRCGRV